MSRCKSRDQPGMGRDALSGRCQSHVICHPDEGRLLTNLMTNLACRLVPPVPLWMPRISRRVSRMDSVLTSLHCIQASDNKFLQL